MHHSRAGRPTRRVAQRTVNGLGLAACGIARRPQGLEPVEPGVVTLDPTRVPRHRRGGVMAIPSPGPAAPPVPSPASSSDPATLAPCRAVARAATGGRPAPATPARCRGWLPPLVDADLAPAWPTFDARRRALAYSHRERSGEDDMHEGIVAMSAGRTGGSGHRGACERAPVRARRVVGCARDATRSRAQAGLDAGRGAAPGRIGDARPARFGRVRQRCADDRRTRSAAPVNRLPDPVRAGARSQGSAAPC